MNHVPVFVYKKKSDWYIQALHGWLYYLSYYFMMFTHNYTDWRLLAKSSKTSTQWSSPSLSPCLLEKYSVVRPQSLNQAQMQLCKYHFTHAHANYNPRIGYSTNCLINSNPSKKKTHTNNMIMILFENVQSWDVLWFAFLDTLEMEGFI